MKKYRLLLVNPKNNYRSGIYHTNEYSVPPMNLGVVAALTPDNWEIKILDENFLDFELEQADLVGLTALTSQITRAYEIATICRKAGIKTVIGGIHASMMPDEALQFVDVVVKGEAESTWKEFIHDFEHGNLSKIYEGSLRPMSESPSPRIDLYPDYYALGTLQTTRGCPMKCDFCSVHTFNGRKYRYKSVETVIEEYKAIPHDKIYIVDDDFYGYGKYHAERARKICKGFIESGVKKEWYTFTSMDLAKDPETLKLMFDAGCRLVLLGIESELTNQLEASEKITNLKVGVENYEKVYDAFHKAGIAVLGSFIFGLDSDTPETIRGRTNYFLNSGVDCIQAGMLTPLPGTKTYFDMLEQNRIIKNDFPKDWERFTFFNNVIKPKNMTHEEFTQIMDEEWERIYGTKTIKRKFLKTLKSTKNVHAAGWALSTNIQYRNTVFETKKEFLKYTDFIKQLISFPSNSQPTL
ncbi:MAG: radical SAM protein [Bacteroidales bacterium]|jgi:radical SAM superfamily enzyme YgiQ (UPF0313 family)